MRWLSVAVIASATAVTGALFAHLGEVSSDDRAAAAQPLPSGPTESVVLVTLDGVRASEVFVGADPSLAGAEGLPSFAKGAAEKMLPNIHALFFKGGTALGDPRLGGGGVKASGLRYVSLPGYFEMMVGAPSPCRSNDCYPKLGDTIADEIARGAGSPDAAAVFGSWEEIARAATSAGPDGLVMVSAGRAEGDTTSAAPGHGRYRPDSATCALALDYLRQASPRFLWVALGDADEWAHANNYAAYLRSLRAADRFVGEVASVLAAKGERGEKTMLIMATDHGRGPSFKDHGEAGSESVWLLARGPEVAARGAVPVQKPRFLRDIAPTIRAVLGLPAKACKGCGEVLDEILRRPEDQPPSEPPSELRAEGPLDQPREAMFFTAP
jgi:hypothetical protein